MDIYKHWLVSGKNAFKAAHRTVFVQISVSLSIEEIYPYIREALASCSSSFRISCP